MALRVVFINHGSKQFARSGLVKGWHVSYLSAKKKAALVATLILLALLPAKLKMLAYDLCRGSDRFTGPHCCEIPQFANESRIETPPPLNPFRVNALRITGIVSMIAYFT